MIAFFFLYCFFLFGGVVNFFNVKSEDMEISIIFLMVLFFFPLMAITMEKIFKFAVFYISIQIF